MLYFLSFIFIFSITAKGEGQWCKLIRKSDGKTLAHFYGDCAKPNWGGDWGDTKLVRQEVDTAKKQTTQETENERRQKEQATLTKKSQIRQACASNTGVLKLICDFIAE